jgi:S-DNA-T family DNA segregation ATPase FtsK/SpoIIIE
MMASYLASGVTFMIGSRNYKKQLAKAKDEHSEALRALEVKLNTLRQEQLRVLHDVDPEPAECLRRAQRKSSRLGERRPEDPDFLYLRLGIGRVPTTLNLEPPKAETPSPEFVEESKVAQSLYQEFSTIPDAPVCARLPWTGSLGIAGGRYEVLGVARALVAQIVTHHWPTEVQVGVVGRPAEAHTKPAADSTWSWMADLPHGTIALGWRSASSSPDEQTLSALMTELEAMLQRREQAFEAQRQGKSGELPPPLPRVLILFDHLPLTYAHPGLSLLLEKGQLLGVYGIFLTDKADNVPSDCGAIIEVASGRLTYKEIGPEGLKLECKPDLVDLKQAEALAQALEQVDWPLSEDLARPPELITFLSLFGAPNVKELPVESWWDEEPPFGYLCAPIGRTSATGDMIFNLNDQDGAHGPHGLIGGMTGSGKSEVLKTLLLALAATHSPYDLNFALIDYKGGAAFNELAKLPHTVGVITDIESHATYGERVILALNGEIDNRKRILENARAAFGFGRSHIDEYRRLPVKRPLPRLVVVFDEFAEFKQRHPAESKRLISIARQGRSLGVHLILATQNIEAAIDPEILQNSTFRICLRVSQVQDSIQMVGIPDAVNLTRGRGYFRAQTRQLFQAAYAGGSYSSEQPGARGASSVYRLWPDGRKETIDLPKWAPTDGKDGAGEQAQFTEAQAIVDRLGEAARHLRLKRPPPVWPNPLPDRLYLPEILGKHVSGGWDNSQWHPCRPWAARNRTDVTVHPVLGLYDHPAEQKQVVFQIDPVRGGGHLLIFGSAGTGKSTLLRTLVTSLAYTRRPDEVHAYILDFGGQATLKALEPLPHVGAVVTRGEAERVERLIRHVQGEVARRDKLFRKERLDSWADFNARVPPQQRLPAIYLIIDGFGEFKRTFPPELVREAAALVSGGAAAGLFMVVSTNLQADVPNDLFANINLRLTFHQADQTEYFRIVGKPSDAKVQEEIGKAPPPGRGLLRGTPPLEFQAALPTSGLTDEDQARDLANLAESMRRAWKGSLPAPIRSLPLLLTLPEQRPMGARSTQPTTSALTTVLGQDYEGLSPVILSLDDDGPTFLVAGVSPQSGKTSLLQSWVLNLAERYWPNDIQMIFLDHHARTMSPFRRLPHKMDYVGSASGLEDVGTKLAEEIKRRQESVERAYERDPDGFDSRTFARRWPRILIVIDDYDRFAGQADAFRRRLADLLTSGGELGVSFLLSGNASELPRDYDDPLMQRTRKHGCGVLLCGTDGIEQFNEARRPQGSPGSGLPPGRGYMISRGRPKLFQAAVYWREEEPPSDALSRRLEAVLRRFGAPKPAANPPR